MKPKTLFLLSLLPATWIALLGLTYSFQYKAGWFKVLAEIITIPLVVLAVVFLLLALINWKKEKFAFPSFSFFSILLIIIALAALFTS